MTFAPQSLLELAAYWKRQTGVNLGIVGDTAHLDRGVSYHLGKDQLIPGAYSATTRRDKAGLTNAASAIDLGKLDGSYKELRAFSDWLARKCVKNMPGTVDVREVIYWVEGEGVMRFLDGIDYLIPGGASASHEFHTHISFYRDSEFRNKTALFYPYFQEAAVQDFIWTTSETTSAPGTVTVNEAGVSAILPDGKLFALPQGTRKHSYGLGKFKGGGWDGQEAYVIGDGMAFLLKRNVSWAPDLEP